MPHKIDVAPTGRASCRGCKQTIAKGTPRFGEEFANPYSEDGGTSHRYWHLACAATKLANELAPVLAAYDGPVEDRAALEALVAQHMRPEMPYLEHAPNGRARCRACDESIAKGELRAAFERVFEGPMGAQKGAAYAHARCLGRYVEREKERGSEAVDATELLRQLEAHSRATASTEDLAAARAALAAVEAGGGGA
jgi:hypothetical protein